MDPLRERAVDAIGLLGPGRLNVKKALEIAPAFVGATDSSARRVSTSKLVTLVVGQGTGGEPRVRRVDARGIVITDFYAYDKKFRGGVRVAVGDVTGDGVSEIVTGAGPGGGPQVRVFDLDGHVINQFFAARRKDRNGIRVAVADTNGDGVGDIIVAGKGLSGQVRIFSRDGKLLGAFYPFDRSPSDLQVAIRNTDDDAEPEFGVARISGQDSLIRLFESNGRYVSELKVFGEWYRGGVFVTFGDLDADGHDEIIASVASAWTLASSSLCFREQKLLLIAYGAGFMGGVQVALGDLDQNDKSELYTMPASVVAVCACL